MDEQNRPTFDDVIKDHPELDTPEYREIWEKDREHREAMQEVQNSFNDIYSNVKIYHPITGRTQTDSSFERVKALDEKYKQNINDKGDFVASFDGCSVSSEIMGEWNVIKNEISDYLFSNNYLYGKCPHMKEFFFKEKQHLDSIKNKLGANAIEYQMICSLVAEAIILDIESCLILQEKLSETESSPAIKKLSYRDLLKDSLNVLEDVSALNMEYQYKYEKFTPFYKSLSEKGRLAGLAKDEPAKSKSGCFSIIVLAIISTLLCSFMFL